MTFKDTTFDGKYQWFWFKLFDFLRFIGSPIEMEGKITIQNFNINWAKLKPGSGSYLFAKFCEANMNSGNQVLRIEGDGTIIYKNPLRK